MPRANARAGCLLAPPPTPEIPAWAGPKLFLGEPCLRLPEWFFRSARPPNTQLIRFQLSAMSRAKLFFVDAATWVNFLPMLCVMTRSSSRASRFVPLT